jgi:hypothetical protein
MSDQLMGISDATLGAAREASSARQLATTRMLDLGCSDRQNAMARRTRPGRSRQQVPQQYFFSRLKTRRTVNPNGAIACRASTRFVKRLRLVFADARLRDELR